MRLSKRVISAVLAVCMAITILPANMQWKAAAEETVESVREEIEVPEEPVMLSKALADEAILREQEEREFRKEIYRRKAAAESAGEDTNVNKVSRKYVPTGVSNFSLGLYLTEKPYDTEESCILYLFDESGEMAAKSISPAAGMSVPGRWGIYSSHVYRARELKANEVLYVGYKSDKTGGEIKRLPEVTLTVTDQPYIEEIIRDRSLYSGTDTASVAEVRGYNVDFSKLSFDLIDEDTNAVVASSVNSMQIDERQACYCIEWKSEADRDDSNTYTVSYRYLDDSEVLAEKGAGNYWFSEFIERGHIQWNSKKNAVEYCNREMPAGATVSYEIKGSHAEVDSSVSGSGITVSESHLVEIEPGNLPNGYYYLTIKYNDGEQEKSWDDNFSIVKGSFEENKTKGTGTVHLNPFFGTDSKIEISAKVFSDDVLNNESKLADACKVTIYTYYTEETVGEAELSLKRDGNAVLYSGTCESTLSAGMYKFSFLPDGEHELRYAFYVYDNDKLYLMRQENNIDQGSIILQFMGNEISYYKNPENLNKIKIKILDIEGNEIGTYAYSNGDFTVNDFGYYGLKIEFTDTIKQKLSNLYYCDVYFCYGDKDINGSMVKYGFFSGTNEKEVYEDFYKYTADFSRYIKGDDMVRTVSIARFMEDYSESFFDDPYPLTFNAVSGSDSAFPVKLIITDWYSLKPVKEITIDKKTVGDIHIFTESELEGLSSDKLYNVFLKGADGSVGSWLYCCYLGTSTYEPAVTPTATPSSRPGHISNYTPSGGSTSPVVVNTATPQPTVEPTAAPTVQPTAEPTATVQPTAEPTAVPTMPPTDIKEPDDPVVSPDVSVPEKKAKLTLKKSKITLKKGQKAQIKITSKLTTGVTYKSLKPSVATVSKKGVVTAKKVGTAVITVKANGQTKKVKVTVKKAANSKKENTEKTSSVKLNKNFKLTKKSVTLKIGRKLTIQKASGLSGKVTFRSLNKKIASVSVKGVVKAKKKGKTTILIKKGKKTVKLKVTVKK